MSEEQAPPLEISFESGGEICRAWHFLPESHEFSSYGRIPCVVMGHGFGGTRDAGLVAYARRFAAEGMHVVIFDYRHFGVSGGAPRQLISIEKQLQDWAAAAAFAREMQGVDASRVALWGSSLSGGHVVKTAFLDRRIAAVIAQCPALDGAAALKAYLRYAGVLNGLKLFLAGVNDKVRGFLKRPPKMLPIVGKPGSLAFLCSADSEPGYLAIAPRDWRNETAARIALGLAFYKPVKHLEALSCPLLLQFCQQDVIAPPVNMERVKNPRGRANIVVKTYDCGHFDLYRGEWFEQSIAHQIAFLKTVFT